MSNTHRQLKEYNSIGNLHDWSIRQDRALYNADIIACEDTRITGMLIRLLKLKNIREGIYDLYGEKVDVRDENEKDEDDITTQDILFSSTKELAEYIYSIYNIIENYLS